MTRPRVYLAGPITGRSYGAATDWRAQVAADLAQDGIETFSPLRAKIYLKDETSIDGSPGAYQRVHPLSAPKGICTRDRWDCQRVDVVLMNVLGATRVSIGSMIELGWADAARVPVVLAIDPEVEGAPPGWTRNPHDHAMVHELAGYIVHNLEAGVAIVRALVLP